MTFEEYWKSRHGEGPTSTYGISEARDAWNAALEEAAKVAEGYPKYGDATAAEIRALIGGPT